MKAVKNVFCLLFTLLMLLTSGTFTGCKKQEIIWVEYGASNDIPCLQIPGAEIATVDEFRYILRKVSKVGVPEDWGILEKKIKEEDRPIENRHYGSDVYLTRYENTSLETYNDFVETMESQGFKVLAQSDVGEKVYTTALTYQNNSYTVSYFVKTRTIDVTASKEDHLSPNLQKENPSTNQKAVDGISTTLTVRPLSGNGTGFVIQLPNGHFVISGGGSIYDLGKLLTYLEENTPEGQIPVVDAWFVNSGSYDLCSWIMGFLGPATELKYTPELLTPVPAKDRIRVEGIYYNMPGADVLDATQFVEKKLDGETYHKRESNTWPTRLTVGAKEIQTQDGKETPVYRLMSGQVYYFNGGLTVEVPLTQEQLNTDEYGLEFKNTSSSLLFRAEGKTLYDMGYLQKLNQQKLVETYGEEFFSDMDVLVVPYRGRRLYEEYQDAFCGKLIIYPNSKVQQLEPEYAAVYQHYAQKTGVQLYSYSNGILRYDFATGKTEIQ